MLPFFLQHYQSFANEITIYDNHSTDNSVHIMNKAGINVEYFETDNTIRDDIMIDLKNQFWKKSRGIHDWVIVVDIDEFIYHSNLKRFFLKHYNKSLLIPIGYNMFTNTMPSPKEQIYKQVQHGVPNPKFNKPCIFRPNKIKEINFEVGCHKAAPTGEVIPHFDLELKLLHYDYLTLEYRIKKCQSRGKRLSEINRQCLWGTQYMQTLEEITRDYQAKIGCSERVVWTN